MKTFLILFLFAITSFAQTPVVLHPSNWLSWKHNKVDIDGNESGVARFNIYTKYLVDVEEPVLRHTVVTAPENVEVERYSLNVINIFRDVVETGAYDIIIEAIDRYDFVSESRSITVTWNPSPPEPVFDIEIRATND